MLLQRKWNFQLFSTFSRWQSRQSRHGVGTSIGVWHNIRSCQWGRNKTFDVTEEKLFFSFAILSSIYLERGEGQVRQVSKVTPIATLDVLGRKPIWLHLVIIFGHGLSQLNALDVREDKFQYSLIQDAMSPRLRLQSLL